MTMIHSRFLATISDLTGRISRSNCLHLRLSLVLRQSGPPTVSCAECLLQAFIITLREGLEAFLIVAISLAYLRKSGRHELVPAVHWGIGLSILLTSARLFCSSAPRTRRCGKVCWRLPRDFVRVTHHPYVANSPADQGDIEGHLRVSTLKSGSARFSVSSRSRCS